MTQHRRSSQTHKGADQWEETSVSLLGVFYTYLWSPLPQRIWKWPEKCDINISLNGLFFSLFMERQGGVHGKKWRPCSWKLETCSGRNKWKRMFLVVTWKECLIAINICVYICLHTYLCELIWKNAYIITFHFQINI